MRIWVAPPRLRVTLSKRPADGELEPLPPAVEIPRLVQQLKAKGGEGKPSIARPENLKELAAHHLRRPDGLPDWQWKRIEELRSLGTDPHDVSLHLGRGYNFASLFSGDPEIYRASMRELLAMPPRTWHGHLTSDFAILPVAYADMLPPAVVDHLRLYWTAWLHPDVEDRRKLDGDRQLSAPSYFRGYSNGGGTMNFGHNAVMGALLAGQFLDAPYVLNNARHGVEHLVRYWGFGSGRAPGNRRHLLPGDHAGRRLGTGQVRVRSRGPAPGEHPVAIA